jgi:hypothetical protein
MIALVGLGHDGRLCFVSTPAGATIAQLRRAQARAAETGPGLDISRALLTAKITRQSRLEVSHQPLHLPGRRAH